MAELTRVRVDKWLWAARFFKTRTLAGDAVSGGKVDVNDVTAKPSKEVHVGDTVRVSVGHTTWVVGVTGLADKRGSATVARTLYQETAESIAAREAAAALRRVAPPLGADMGARPTKRDRRRIDSLRARGGPSARDT